GLALSSRNAHLDGPDRDRAVALSRALQAAERAAQHGETDAAVLRQAAREAMTPFDVEPEYLALVDPETLTPVERVRGEALLAAARLVHTGDTVIVISYAEYDEADLETYEPRVVHVDAQNQIIDVDQSVGVLLTEVR